MAETAHADVKKLSFERAIEELESIVKRLEDGKVPLEESVAIYERGESLKRRCEELLRQAEARVDKITTDASGQARRHRAARRAVTDFSPVREFGLVKSNAAMLDFVPVDKRRAPNPCGRSSFERCYRFTLSSSSDFAAIR